MCGLCPDCVEICMEGNCRGPSGKHYTGWYLDDTNMCDHMLEKYGTRDASLLNHVRQEHSPGRYHRCPDNCIREQWWGATEVQTCVDKVYEGESPETY